MNTDKNNRSSNLPYSVKLNSKKSVGVVLTNVTRIMIYGYAHLSSVEFAGFIITLFYLLFEKVKGGFLHDPLPVSDKELSDRLSLPIRKIKKYLRVAKYTGVIVVKERGVGMKVSKYYLKIPTSKPDPKVKRYLTRLFRKEKWLNKYSQFRDREKRALESYLIAKCKENINYSSIAFQFRAIPSYRNRPEKRMKRENPIIGNIDQNNIDQTAYTYPLTAITKGKVFNDSNDFVSTEGQLSSSLGLVDLAGGITKSIQEEPDFISSANGKTQNIEPEIDPEKRARLAEIDALNTYLASITPGYDKKSDIEKIEMRGKLKRKSPSEYHRIIKAVAEPEPETIPF
jgi:hypothetical protein